MLITRVLTALLLLPPVFLALFAAPHWGFVLFVLAFVVVASVEWASLGGIRRRITQGLFAVIVGGIAAVLTLVPDVAAALAVPVLVVGSLLWLAATVTLIPTLPTRGLWSIRWLRVLFGAAVIVAAAPAFAALHLRSPWLVVMLFLIVWGCDIGAYFVGRWLGHTPLAPVISPAKTIEGALGGIGAGLLLGLLAAMLLPVPGLERVSLPMLLALLGLVTVTAMVGDLLESLLKRVCGVKDSGGLLPGHGGVLDRVDSLLAAAPVFAVFVLWQQA